METGGRTIFMPARRTLRQSPRHQDARAHPCCLATRQRAGKATPTLCPHQEMGHRDTGTSLFLVAREGQHRATSYLVAMSSSSPPQPQYSLGKPLIFMYWSGVRAETPPKYCE